jgi:hypothetical protein
VRIKPNVQYDVLVAVNGTNVTLVIDGVTWFTYNYEPQLDEEGLPIPLNKGYVGVGMNGGSGKVDNFTVQVLPPEMTLEHEETFDSSAGLFTGDQEGTWTIGQVSYEGQPATEGGTAWTTLDLGLDQGLHPSSYLELEARVLTNATGGIFFDRYADDRFKFVVLDQATDQILVGHQDPRHGWVVDAAIDHVLNGSEYDDLKLAVAGTSVRIHLNDQFVAAYGFNAPLVDGNVGLLSRGGHSSFESFILRTNDPAFEVQLEAEGEATSAALSLAAEPSVTMDVNRDGTVSALDALIVLNAINLQVDESATFVSDVAALRYDVSGDYVLSALDVLLVINYLNAATPVLHAAAEGEAVDESAADPDHRRAESSRFASYSGQYEVADSFACDVSEQWNSRTGGTADDDALSGRETISASAIDKALDQLFREI